MPRTDYDKVSVYAERAHLLSTDAATLGITSVQVSQAAVHVLSAGEEFTTAVSQLAVHVLSTSAATPVATGLPGVESGSDATYVAEVHAATSEGVPVTILLSDGEGWATGPSDTPANTVVYPRMAQATNLERSMFASRATFGAVSASYGLCEIANADGAFDAWVGYTFAGRAFVLRAGAPGAAYPSQWTTVMTGVMQGIEADLDRIRIRLRDRMEILQSTVLRDTSQVDPAVYGNVLSVTPVLVDAATLEYALGRPPTGKLVVVDALRDEGVALTHESGGVPSSATVIDTEAGVATATITSGRYNWNPDSGRMRLGITPTGQLTATLRVIDDDADWELAPEVNPNVRVGTMLSQMAQSAGITAADIDAGDVSDLDLLCSSIPYGIWTEDDTTVADAMTRASNSLGAWFGFDRANVLRMAQFAAITTDSVWAFTQHNIIAGSLRRVTPSDSTAGVPVWRVLAQSGHVDSPISTFAGAADAATRAALGVEWAVQTASESTATKTAVPGAGELTLEVYSGGSGYPTLEPAGDNGEAARRLAMYAPATEMVQLDAFASPTLLSAIELGSVVTLTFPRYGWDSGVQFVVTGERTDLARRVVTYTLWRCGPAVSPDPIPEPPPTSTQWRLYVYEPMGGSGYAIGITEIEFRTSIGGSNACVDGTITASSEYGTPYAAAYAMDGNVATFWDSALAQPQWWQYTFPSAVTIVEVAITAPASYNLLNAPAWFDLQCLVGEEWVSTLANIEVAWTNNETRTVSESTPAKCAWRVTGTANGGSAVIGIAEIQLRGSVGGANLCTGGAAFAKSSYGSYGGSYGPSKAFDGDANTFWDSLSGPPQWIIYKFAAAHDVAELAMTAPPGGNAADMATAFTLDYWDGTGWTTALTRSGLTWTAGETKTFAL